MFQQSIRILIGLLLIALRALPGFSQDASPDGASAAKQQSIDELFLFVPSKYPEGNWSPEGLRFTDVEFTADDATKLHGWYCPCDNPRQVVLIAHGNAGHVASRANWLKYLQSQAKVSVFMFDYRGYGRSEGIPTVEGVLKDAQAARAKLCELARIQENQMVLMGESLGGAIVIQLAAQSSPRALILQSTFSSMRDMADVHFAKFAWLVPKNRLDSVAQLPNYRGPLLQSHGNADRVVPIALARKLFSVANEPKRFVPIENADHNDWLTDAYLRELGNFLIALPH